ncbi:AraC-type DNA-binding protein [Saccharopolyspora antimicrobica]|uniref:AraC family transcriptional regulator n=1 Tax=Saccharopolyspora antimicrobica TaxID=455193 RepID=A0A1I4YFP8_9PSEU|nr:AraC family transcriptional regulator [Saccharopolyspora antimicrobica]RKT82654.1 AraC family transcriptional regulator [Saccharopolyspora antimicrobica]SFN36812.1 AraC-type DNA-binding protein [Saccharopolyspora antimicrobica]
MDTLAGLLDGPRARGAFLLRSILEPPWSLRIQDRAPLTLVAVVRGSAWVLPDGGEPALLEPGDVAVVRGPGHYTVADDPGTPWQVVIHPGQRCTSPNGTPLDGLSDLGVRTWGTGRAGTTTLLTGTYQVVGEVSDRVLTELPELAVVRHESLDAPLIDLLAAEIGKNVPGQETVLDRLLDLLLIAALRAWFAGSPDRTPAWYSAQCDEVVGQALQLIHDTPAEQWTVAGLAASCGLSRAGFARRFTEVVGEPPMTYLTSWRLALAADLLRESDATIGAVARQVGYGSAFALSNAFKRRFGISPQEYRRHDQPESLLAGGAQGAVRQLAGVQAQ